MMSLSGSVKSTTTQRMLATSGVIGPILFTAVVVILALLRPEYSHISQPISDLGAVGAPNATIQDANFIVFGLLVLAFAYGLHKGIGDGKGSKIGPIAVAFFGGFSAIGDGIFPLPMEPFHTLLFLVGIIPFMVGTFVISRRLKQDTRWQGYRLYSLATGVIAVILFLVLLYGATTSLQIFGALQRLFLAPLFIWIEVMAIHLLRLSSQPHPLKMP